MKYCSKCGNQLIIRNEENEGPTPYCPKCNEFKYPQFNDAISAVLTNKEHNKILLIQQYNRTNNILVAGYISKGEKPSETLIREIKEEVNLDVNAYAYNDSSYYEKSNTLIHNFIAEVNDEDFKLNEKEVDYANWYSISEAKKAIYPNSLAQRFLNQVIDKLENQQFVFEKSEH